MNVQFTIEMEAARVVPTLELWLEESLPVDFEVRQKQSPKGLRRLGVTITGATYTDVIQKARALKKVLTWGRWCPFDFTMTPDPSQINL